MMRILMIGDIVGKPGRQLVCNTLSGLRIREGLDLVIANAENCAGGSGLTNANYRALIDAGIDCITLGDHAYRRREIFSVLESEENIVRPANMPAESPGKDWVVVTAANGVKVAVFCLLGRVFMNPVNCPFHRAEAILEEIPADVKVRWLDFHAEATSDMQIMGRLLAGRATAVLGTHTHVATADEQIFPGGTAFQCDVGMTGPFESILGRRIDRVTETTMTARPTPFDVANKDVRINGTIVDLNAETGQAMAIKRLVVFASEANELLRLSR